MPHSFSAALCLGFLRHLFKSAKKNLQRNRSPYLKPSSPRKKQTKKDSTFFLGEGQASNFVRKKRVFPPPTKDMFKSSTVDGRNPAPLGMYKTLLMVGQTTNLNWWSQDFWTINSMK